MILRKRLVNGKINEKEGEHKINEQKQHSLNKCHSIVNLSVLWDVHKSINPLI